MTRRSGYTDFKIYTGENAVRVLAHKSNIAGIGPIAVRKETHGGGHSELSVTWHRYESLKLALAATGATRDGITVSLNGRDVGRD